MHGASCVSQACDGRRKWFQPNFVERADQRVWLAVLMVSHAPGAKSAMYDCVVTWCDGWDGLRCGSVSGGVTEGCRTPAVSWRRRQPTHMDSVGDCSERRTSSVVDVVVRTDGARPVCQLWTTTVDWLVGGLRQRVLVVGRRCTETVPVDVWRRSRQRLLDVQRLTACTQHCSTNVDVEIRNKTLKSRVLSINETRKKRTKTRSCEQHLTEQMKTLL